MGCQRDPTAARRIRLTDQALVGVLVAREHAAAHDRAATSADVVVGLGVEPDGAAGHRLRGRAAALAALAERSGALPPGLAALEEVLAAAADRAAPRPPATQDLLAAALTVGGEDLDDLLARCGYEPADLWPDGDADAAGETVTLEGPGTPRLDPPATRAVGQVRALAGGAVDLLVALAEDPGADAADLLGAVDPAHLDAARKRPEPEEAAEGAPWDTGLPAVLEAAAVLAGDRPAGTPEVLRAVLVAGGRGPLAVLERGRRASTDEEGRR